MSKSKIDIPIKIKPKAFVLKRSHDPGLRYTIALSGEGFLVTDSSSNAPAYRATIPTNVATEASILKKGDKIATPLADLLESPIGLISVSQAGLSFESFLAIAYDSPFAIEDWANFLQSSEKELVSQQKESKTFNQAQSEIILQIAQLQKLGTEVLGSQERFAIWASTPTLVFEGKRPKDFFGSTFGIQMLTTELHRIEYGILA